MHEPERRHGFLRIRERISWSRNSDDGEVINLFKHAAKIPD